MIYLAGCILALSSLIHPSTSKPVSTGHSIRFENHCPETIWVGATGGPSLPEDGGFELLSNRMKVLFFPKSWSGRFWGRTGCDSFGRSCETGDCGDGKCAGQGGAPPTTLAEITFGDGTPGGLDFYDISLVDGYNLQMSMEPIPADGNPTGYSCIRAGCDRDLNLDCPKELQKKNKFGETVACNSACNVFGNDQFCCKGSYDNPTTCQPSQYSKIFKKACPLAYSYAYDDQASTFTCGTERPGVRQPSPSQYVVKFCPKQLLREEIGNILLLSQSN